MSPLSCSEPVRVFFTPQVWRHRRQAARRREITTVVVRPKRGFMPGGDSGVVVPGRPVSSSAAAEAAGQPILGHVRGPNNRWIPELHERVPGSHAPDKGSRCERLASWARRCVARDAAGRLLVGCGGVTLPAMVALHRLVVCALAVGLLWATSLSVARHFTSRFVTAPPLPQVVGACNYAYREVLLTPTQTPTLNPKVLLTLTLTLALALALALTLTQTVPRSCDSAPCTPRASRGR